MRLARFVCCMAVGLGSWGCGGSEGDGDGGGDTVTTLPPGSGPTTEPATTAEDSGGATSAATSAATTTGPASSSDGADGETGPAVYFDVGMMPDGGGEGWCQPGMSGGMGGKDEPEFSFLWACNSTQGTISKIDTQTVTEVARYYTRPDLSGSPSRTSVSLSGHAAVANRSGGITKFWATQEDCQDTNGVAGIQTSVGNAPLPWDQEECRAWHIPFGYSSQRPVAWAPGEWNSQSCEWENEMLWTAGRNGSGTDAEVVLIDGDAGIVVDTAAVMGLKADQYGLYGGAVDSEGNFWATGWATGNHLVRVDIDTMAVTVWPGPSVIATSHWYGMTVDVNGYVWNCASRVARFDPVTELWAVSNELPHWNAGCMADDDPNGLLWLGSQGLLGIDRETFAVVHQWPTPTSYGVSIDFYGYVWAVNGNGAHRVDPSTGTVTSYNGLVGAYTYSDMTGFALNTVGGGGAAG
ncbi:NHL repeat-containing protein [Paraliomyxa miuraensis]|uniref:hypothetical protein n=1 Tax=Paraliomyxa miuraensis TaxID=376150 RepID=UPI0022572446|nr:hypothetical protein [Paraliomyxa miuraensis]MCX4247735.1 hypothetical protein [Paraliomyxa miuraensis]